MPASPDPASSSASSSSPQAGSEARESHVGRRVLALIVDWAVASAISAGFFDLAPMATLAVFAVMTALQLMTLGATIGHRITGLRVYRQADGGSPPRPLQALMRTVLLCLVVPVGIWGPDGRGLHDAWSGTFIDRWSIPA